MDSGSVNPYKILGVNKNFTLDELRNQYKRIALQVHPDKGGSNELFQLVTNCYKRLLKHYEKKMEKDFLELKNEFKQFDSENKQQATLPTELADLMHSRNNDTPSPAHSERGLPRTSQGPVAPQKQEFMTAFNRMFEENRLEEATQAGYGNTMAQSSQMREDINIPNKMKTFKINSFNKAFDKQAVNKDNREMIAYRQPEPTLMAKNVGFSELGVAAINDFSGANDTIKKVNYMDYMKAHTTSRLIDPKMVSARPEFKNVEALESHRSTNMQMSESEWKDYGAQLDRQREMEENRLAHQMQQDRLYEAHHAKMNQKMLMFRR